MQYEMKVQMTVNHTYIYMHILYIYAYTVHCRSIDYELV